MSLNLQLKSRRARPILKWRRFILWLALIAIILAGLVYVRRNWPPETALAALNQDVLANLPVNVPKIQQQQPKQPPAEDVVVMVDETVIENPHSEAYTADLLASTGKDDIPWPHVGDRATLQSYTVQEGDSLWGIAQQFELDIDTLRWSNPDLERNPDILTVGAELRILPVPGAFHTVQPDDTLDTIAAIYGVSPQDITEYPPNALFPPYELEPGQGLIIPFGRKDGQKLPEPSLAPDSPFAWPIVGIITQGFKPSHLAIDIGAPYGSTVYAADDGTITYADWAQTGYGYTIIIDHGSGRETWYNHLKGTLLPAGNFVTRGTPIGQSGSTGHSTGPHLHFEVRLNGERVNPIDYLPGTTPQ